MRVLAAALVLAAPPVPAAEVALYRVTGDAIVEPLTASPGDPARGRDVVIGRDAGNCQLCHAVPHSTDRFAGDIGPSLTGIGRRLTAAQIRLRIVDASRVNPQTIMPPYHRTERLSLVARPFAGQPVLTAQQVEDAVAFLARLVE
jgi:sulfur-oxidizing protein SoxX